MLIERKENVHTGSHNCILPVRCQENYIIIIHFLCRFIIFFKSTGKINAKILIRGYVLIMICLFYCRSQGSLFILVS